MKKLNLLLLLAVLIAPFLQSCTDDQSSLADPRDAIAKSWRVNDNGAPNVYYDVVISKDASDLTKVWFTNFHNLGTSERVYGTLASSIITIPSQTTTSGYTIDGEGTIVNSDKITFEYTLDEGDGPDDYTAEFGKQIAVKKKAIQ